MPKRLTIQPHLPVEDLETRYRAAPNGVERSHLHIVWLLARGQTTEAVANVTGFSVDWIRKLAGRYNQAGPAALADQRQHNPGAPMLLSEEQRQALWAALQEPPPDGGLWTGPKVAAWMSTQSGRTIAPQRGWEYMRRLGFTPHQPRPRHAKADAAQQEAIKKNFPRP